MTKYVYLIGAIIIAGLMASTGFFYNKFHYERQQNRLLNSNLVEFGKIYDSLAKSYKELAGKTNYAITLAPNINSKIASTFGTSKNLTFQYYFTMDGNKIEIEPDSTKLIKK